METRTCPYPDCDAEISSTEESCPKCTRNIKALDDQIAAQEAARKAVIKKRKMESAKRKAAKKTTINNVVKSEKRSFFSNLILGRKK